MEFLRGTVISGLLEEAPAGELFELVVELKEKTGCDIRFVNLSGGVGIPYKPDQEPNDISVIGAGVHEMYDKIVKEEELNKKS